MMDGKRQYKKKKTMSKIGIVGRTNDLQYVKTCKTKTKVPINNEDP